MSIAPVPQGALHPEDALALVEPDRREFAILYAEGKTAVPELCKTAGISAATYYRWIKDERILAYADALGRDSGRRAKRRIRGMMDDALDTMHRALTDDSVTPTMLQAAKEILDRGGATKEELTRSGQGGGDTVVQVNIAVPINPDARNEQEERRRRREMAQEATYVDVTDA